MCEIFFYPSLLLGSKDEEFNQTMVEETFLTWYFAEERESIRNDISERIQKILAPVEAKFTAKAEKV